MSISGLLKGCSQVSSPSCEVTKKLQGMLPAHPFHIKADEVLKLAGQLGITVAQLMVELIPIACEYAAQVVPISNYKVGSCVMGLSGDLYLGVNMEFSGDNLAQTVHSEQSSVTNAMCHGEKGVAALAVSAEPCGSCRQFLNELACADDLIITIPNRNAASLQDLLPHAFGPKHLGVESGLLAACELPLVKPEGDDPLTKLAWEAANKAYAPYSHCNGGVALQFEDGFTVSGWYAENAAFNPSVSPLQAALIMANAAGRRFNGIVKAVLAERRLENNISHVSSTTNLLKVLAPKAELAIKRLEAAE
ncbi:MAG: cytidine deaminase [Candidatus Bruticola sp.]